MAKLGFLLLGLLALWTAPVHASAMKQCPDGAHWYNPADGVGSCPDSFTITGATALTTSVTLTGTVTEASGTVHAALRPSCELLQWRNTTQGTGAVAAVDDTDVSSGTFSINITGLSEGTPLCAHIVQYADDKVTVQKTIQFTTLTTGGTSGDSITGGDDWFFCPDGNDANDGSSNALRKKTIPTTDTSLLGPGDDMWLCTGGVWINSHHDIARQGSSGDWNEIGTYYMDGSTPRKAIDGVFGPETTHTKAVIKGALTDACLAAMTCTFPSTGWPVNGYTSRFDGLWVMSSTADYTDIRNITFSHYQYNSLTASGGGTEGALHHLIFDGVDQYYGGIGARLTFVDGVTDFVVRNGDSYAMNTCPPTRLLGKSTDASVCATGSPWSGTILTVTRKSGRGLVEWNTSRRGFGEGYNCFNTSLGKMIYRNNYAINTWSDGIYLDGCPNSVVESNVMLGGSSVMFGGYENNGPMFAGIHLGCESPSYPNGTGNVVRNNLVVGARQGLEVNQFNVCTTGGRIVGGKFYNNTTIAATNLGKTGSEYEVAVLDDTANVAEAVFTNNAHWNDDTTTSNCSATTAMTASDNAWSHNPADSQCDGAGDTIGSLGLTLSTYASWVALANDEGDHPVTWPAWSQVNPAGGSALIGSGTALTSTILDKDTFGFAWEQIREVLAGTLTEAEWECANCVDAEGTTRTSPWTKGAVQ